MITQATFNYLGDASCKTKMKFLEFCVKNLDQSLVICLYFENTLGKVHNQGV